jgi:hypothetical protein
MSGTKNLTSQQEAIRQLEACNESIMKVVRLSLKAEYIAYDSRLVEPNAKLLESVATNNAQIERIKNLGDNWRVIR